jgi:Ca2+-dependent lipid-binding protein
MVAFTLLEAHNLVNVDPMGHQDPFVELALSDKVWNHSRFVIQ